ncbi:conserved hypothetical protein [Trichinella spiralis]|uniref:hypothetical protein n=1 Tax=Trichinella spiralis TaxID=6334 RepID=UPI0001EFD16B|nr:conserved hypothetical protein [Trichinella spiralis]
MYVLSNGVDAAQYCMHLVVQSGWSNNDATLAICKLSIALSITVNQFMIAINSGVGHRRLEQFLSFLHILQRTCKLFSLKIKNNCYKLTSYPTLSAIVVPDVNYELVCAQD